MTNITLQEMKEAVDYYLINNKKRFEYTIYLSENNINKLN